MAEPLDIDARVRSVLAAALNVAESDLAPAATLQGDLGAESIDVLDIVFRLELAFNLKIAQGELFPEAILLGKPEYIADGKVTDKGLALLRSRMPFADLSGLESRAPPAIHCQPVHGRSAVELHFVEIAGPRWRRGPAGMRGSLACASG